jgi:hypothetical protein
MECKHDNKSDCTDVFCSQEFTGIFISIKHVCYSTAFALTNYKVTRVSDNKDITIDDWSYIPNEYYPITDDSELDLFKFKNVEVEFTGYLNNNIVIQKKFIITADCCHVSLVSGATEFYL